MCVCNDGGISAPNDEAAEAAAFVVGRCALSPHGVPAPIIAHIAKITHAHTGTAHGTLNVSLISMFHVEQIRFYKKCRT